MLRLADEPNTAIALTSISPRVSANAVAAVRRGLRTALVRASRPTAPNGAATGAPTSADDRPGQRRRAEQHAEDQQQRTEPDQAGRAAAGLGARAPATSAAAPSSANTAPMMVRRRSERAGRGELLAHGRHRRGPGCAPGRGVGAEQR